MPHVRATRPARIAKAAIAATTSTLLIGMLTAASATADPLQFNIPAQNLATALNEFASQTHMQVTVAPGLESRESGAVSGSMEPADALRLLVGPQLSVEFIDPKSVVVKLPEKSSAIARRHRRLSRARRVSKKSS